MNFPKIKNLFLFIFVIILFSHFTYSKCFSQLNGKYSIGSGGHFTDINSAVNELIKSGISGNVNFEIQNGVYIEQINIPQIKGASPSNQITFQSLSGNRDDVEIKYIGTQKNNFVLSLTNCSFVEFKNLTFKSLNKKFSGLIKISENSNNIRLYGLKLESNNLTANNNSAVEFNGDKIENIILDDILFFNSYSGIINSSSNFKLKNITLYENEFINCQNSISLNNIDGLIIEANYFENINSGVSLKNISGVSKINRNKFLRTVNLGIIIESSKFNLNYPLFISNNSYSGNGVGLNLSSGCENINIVNNTIKIKENILNQNFNSIALYILDCNKISIINNIFTNFTDGVVLNFSKFPNDNLIDFNDFFTTGNKLGYIDNNILVELNCLNKIFKSNLNSVSENPHFKSDIELIPLSEKLKFRTLFFYNDISDIDLNGAQRGSLSGIGAYNFRILPESFRLNSPFS